MSYIYAALMILAISTAVGILVGSVRTAQEGNGATEYVLGKIGGSYVVDNPKNLNLGRINPGSLDGGGPNPGSLDGGGPNPGSDYPWFGLSRRGY